MNSLSQIQNRLLRAAFMLMVTIRFLLTNFLGGNITANAKPMTPEATQYQVDGNPFQAEQAKGEKNAQNTANRLFRENKQPLEAPEITQKIGEALTKTPKAVKSNLEKIAGNAQNTVEEVKD